MDIKKLTLDQIINYITVINLMIKENVIDFNPDNAKVTFKYGNAMAYLENQNIKQEKEIEKLKHENTKLNEIWLCIGELPPHEHNSTIDARQIISRYYEEVERLNNIINEYENWLNELGAQCYVKNLEELQSKIDKATQLYLKELSEKGKVDDLACKMFNTLEGNI